MSSGISWQFSIRGVSLREAIVADRYHLGEEINSGGLSLVVESVRRDDKGSGPLKPIEGNEYVIVKINLKNNTSKSFDFIPLLFFHLKDSAGNVYESTAVPTDGAQLSGALLPQDSIREDIGFEVPKKTGNLVLYFEPGTPGKPTLSIDLK